MSHHWHSEETERFEEELPQLEVDLYGIKARGVSPGAVEQEPSSWREVWLRLNRYLMRLVSDGVGLAADLPTTARGVLKGIRELPGSLAERIRGNADRQEAMRQETLPAFEFITNAEEAAESIKQKFLELRAQGVPVDLLRRSDGSFVLLVVRKDQQAVAAELAEVAARNSLSTLAEPSPDEGRRIAEEEVHKIMAEYLPGGLAFEERYEHREKN